jgi:predicted hydrocarbon binding protein
MAQEVSCKIIRTVLDFAREVGGQESVDALVEAAGIPFEELNDEHNWIDHDAEKRMFRALDEKTSTENAAFRCGEYGVRAGSFGGLEVFIRALMRPRGAYAKVPYIANRLAKVGKMSVQALDSNSARVSYRYFDGYESIPEICEHRRGLLASIPMFWGLPGASVEESSCSARGDEVCAYRITWLEPVKRRMILYGLGLGAVVGIGFAVSAVLGVVELALGWSIVAAMALPLGGALAGLTLDQLRQIGASRDVIRRQNFILSDQLHRLEEKFRQAEELAGHLEVSVAERTEELEHELKRLSIMTDLGKVIGSAKTAEETVELAARGVTRLVPGSGSGLILVGALDSLTSLDGVDPDRIAKGVIQFLEADADWRIFKEPEGGSMLWFRLWRDDTTLGTLVVARTADEEHFNVRDIEIGRAYGQLTVAVLERFSG